MALRVAQNETVGDLKRFMGERLEKYMDEMTVMISMSYPYPLPEHMRLDWLLVEHRDLILRIHEDEIEKEGAWWAQPVPMRYLQWVEGNDESSYALDLRYLPSSSISRIRSWLYGACYISPSVSEIWLLGTHPHVMDILYAVAEDVLSMTNLYKVVLFHPHDDKYIIPAHSVSRHESLQRESSGGGAESSSVWRSHLYREGLVYLYQHLALDRYRNSVELVEIHVDGGLLAGVEKGRWLP
jgi:hypothetical protein